MNNKPIGIFDSGVGGLTVLKEVEELLPYEDIIYLGDTARVPYGNKSKFTVIKFSTESILFLLQKKVKMVVIACNTASSLALSRLVDIFNIPILGVIEAGVRKALLKTERKIGVIGTNATIKSRSYEMEIAKLDKKSKVYSQSCPFFVPLVEEGILKGRIVEEALDMYLKDFKNKKIDTLILGCTHYPLLKEQIALYLKGTDIIDSAKETALHVQSTLKANNLFNKKRAPGEKYFYVTDEPCQFAKLAKLFLKKDIKEPTVINV
ncbi:MAG: glutamate racemase [Candidatus Omnitrophota bacterium]